MVEIDIKTILILKSYVDLSFFSIKIYLKQKLTEKHSMKSLPTSEINANLLFKVFERAVHAGVVRTLDKKTRFVVRSRKMSLLFCLELW